MTGGVARQNVDSAGGLITQGSSDVLVNGSGVVYISAAVQSHGDGSHASATMIEGSSSVFVNGRQVVREGDQASCSHSASGSSDVFCG